MVEVGVEEELEVELEEEVVGEVEVEVVEMETMRRII